MEEETKAQVAEGARALVVLRPHNSLGAPVALTAEEQAHLAGRLPSSVAAAAHSAVLTAAARPYRPVVVETRACHLTAAAALAPAA